MKINVKVEKETPGTYKLVEEVEEGKRPHTFYLIKSEAGDIDTTKPMVLTLENVKTGRKKA